MILIWAPRTSISVSVGSSGARILTIEIAADHGVSTRLTALEVFD